MIGGYLPWPVLFTALTIPMSAKCAQTMINGYDDINAIAMLDMRTAQLQMVFSVVLSIALVVSKFIV